MRPNLDVLRAKVAAMLTEQGTVRRQTGTVFNETTGKYEPVYATLHDGPMLVRPVAREARVVEAGGAVVTLGTYDVSLPAGTAVATDDLVTVTACPYDPALTGKSLRVKDVPLDAWQVTRQIVCVMST